MDTIAMTAVYPHDAAYARAHGELAAYRNARRRNIACKDAIEEAIAKHFDGMHLDEACVKEVLDQYGSERVTLVLAATVQEKSGMDAFLMQTSAGRSKGRFPASLTAGVRMPSPRIR